MDAKKMLMRYRKPTASIVNNVGIWHDIMVGLARIAVITNAFLIAVTSDFIPRLVYTTYHSYTGKGFTSFNRYLSLNRDTGGLCQFHSRLLQHLRARQRSQHSDDQHLPPRHLQVGRGNRML